MSFDIKQFSDITSEMGLVSSFLKYPGEVINAMNDKGVQAKDLHDLFYQEVMIKGIEFFNATKGDELDYLTLISLIDNKIYPNAAADIIELANSAHTNHYGIKNYVQTIHNNKIKTSCAQLRERFFTDEYLSRSFAEDVLEKLNEFNAVINGYAQTQKLYETAYDVSVQVIKDIQANKTPEYYPTGIDKLDVMLEGGLLASTLNIVGARPGVGKSAFASNIICNILKQKQPQYPSIIFSLEMNNKQVVKRMLSSFGGVSSHDLDNKHVNNAQWGKIFEGISQVFVHKEDESKELEYRLLVNEMPNLTISDIQTTLRSVVSHFGGVSAVVVDYLQLMPISTKTTNRAVAIGEISRALKEISRTYNIPVIALAQLNRDVEKRKAQDCEPKASDIRDSGAIEQDADLIMMLERKDAKARIHVVKNRNGAIGKVDCYFKAESCLFCNQLED